MPLIYHHAAALERDAVFITADRCHYNKAARYGRILLREQRAA